MRVVHVLDTPQFAGTEAHVLALIQALRLIGTESVLACRVNSPLANAARESGVAVADLGGSCLSPRAWIRLRAILRQSRADVVHCHNGRTCLAAAFLRASGSSAAFVATQHFIQPGRTGLTGARALIARQVHRRINRRVDKFIAISRATREAMLSRGDGSAEKIALVPNGIAIPARVSERERTKVRAEFGITPGGVLVACVARLETEKDIPTLVEAMALLKGAYPNAMCVVAGEGSQRKALQARAAQLGLGATLRFVGFLKDPARLIAVADVFVLPSIAEPFGLVLVEAMAAGKPVVAVAAGGPLDIVAHDTTGLLVPPRDVAALASAMERLVSSEELRLQMGDAGRQRFEELFTADRMASDVSAVYRAVCPTSRRSHEGTVRGVIAGTRTAV